MKFHLYGENTLVEIDVLSREYPASTSYWDGNWVQSNVKVEIPGYTANFYASLRTDEIESFLNELRLMYQNLSGTANLRNMDEVIHFECKMNKRGTIHWAGKTCYPAGSGAELHFEFVSDQSYLIELIRELEEIIVIHPIIGKA